MKRIKSSHIVLGICLILISLIASMTTMYGDDLIYGTYLSDGFANFVKMNIRHYNELNGRIFVHVLLETLLAAKDRLFFAAVPVMLFGAFFAMSEIFSEKGKTAEFCAYGLMGVMCLSPYLLREGMLWMAGAFNYILPVSFAAAAFYAVERSYNFKKNPPYCLVLAFLCGASTEQCAVIAISASVLYMLFVFAGERKVSKKGMILTAVMCLGLLTIVLAPGTGARAKREALESASDAIERLGELYKIALGDFGIAWVFFFTQIVFAVKLRKKAVTGACLAAEAALCLCGKYFAAGAILTTALCALAFSIAKSLPRYACFLLAALLSMGMMVIADSFGTRNFMPAILIMLGICSGELAGSIKNKAVQPIALCVAAAIFAPTISGYVQNRSIINENIKNLEKADGEIFYNADINPLYGYYQFYADSFYTDGIKKIYGLEKDDKIHIRGKDFRDLYVNGVLTENPEYVGGGESYYPMRNVLEACGAKIEYDGKTSIKIGGKTICFDGVFFEKDGEKIPAEGYRLRDTKYGNMFESNVYLTKEAFEDIFDIKI